jgi:D-tagatose-1,6-bisphosphate aldolase subunit GatZ/KbaZ
MTNEELHPVRRIVDAHKSGHPIGIYSVCSANEHVLRAAMRQALRDESVLLVEATCNQVNQFGGYTGQTPERFSHSLSDLCESEGFPVGALILGGDHLGPSVWQKEPAAQAMSKAKDMVRDYVRAGFSKIHLDASMSCAGDPVPLPDQTVAERAAGLCQVAEQTFREYGSGSLAPVYVVGTEVPTPGGALEELDQIQVTQPDEARETLENVRRAFERRDLYSAWERVVALVVQPGVEFGTDSVVDYQSSAAAELSRAIEGLDHLVFEAHSTDYQSPDGLRSLVRDHFAILKVGPWLTFAVREAIFALARIEEELLSVGNGKSSRIRAVLETEMLQNPGYWLNHYHGTEIEQALQRGFSLSDRIRYYWQRPAVMAALDRLIGNLSVGPVPVTLLHQYLPAEAEVASRRFKKITPDRLIGLKIESVLQVYSDACHMTGNRN